ncbi:MAG: tRNA guanosine(34) transglycosylase Tgt [Saprospirales bacterium]|nr:MAG: tRNA guanosine(34) transglycosylase Tgt [Saprospirales bacterium]
MKFTITAKSDTGKARSGLIQTSRGEIPTPIFMPVGTLGTVKGLNQHMLSDLLDAPVILGNTYHLYLRPGTGIIEDAGGLHKFINWDRHILTDSGGYQVYSLSGMRKITEEGVKFRSHIDGSSHFFSPESVVDIQRSIGADFIMAFDECPPYPADRKYVKDSMHLTHRWLDRCVEQFQGEKHQYDHPQYLIPIVQGGAYEDLRADSAKHIAQLDLPANAIGGLSVGEPEELLYEMTDISTNHLPVEKPRYLMGVGTPVNLLECIDRGVDMFDCVLPTRNARHGMIFTSEGIINIKNAKWANDHSPLDSNSPSPFSREYSRAYLRHLFHTGEFLGPQIASLQNLSFFLWLVREAGKKINAGEFPGWKKEMISLLSNRL